MSAAQVYAFPTGGRPRLGGEAYGEQVHFLATPQERRELLALAEETGKTQAQLLREALELLSLVRRGRARLVLVEEPGTTLDQEEELPELGEVEASALDPRAKEAPTEAQPLWERLAQKLKERVSQENFDIWLSSCSATEGEAGELVLLVPNAFFQEYLSEHYTLVIKEQLLELGEARDILFSVAPAAEIPPAPKAPKQEPSPGPLLAVPTPPAPAPALTVEEQLKELDQKEAQIKAEVERAKVFWHVTFAAQLIGWCNTLLAELYRQRARLLGGLPRDLRRVALSSLHEIRQAKKELERRARNERRPGKRGAG